MNISRPSARANQAPAQQPAPQAVKAEPKPAPEYTGPEYVAFAIKEHNGQFTAVRLMIEGNKVVHEQILHEGVQYEGLAYEYLSGDVMIEYSKRSLKRETP
jgi:hypothetical protein